MEIRTLTDGGQSTVDVTGWLAEFIEPARTSLDVCLYELRLPPDEAGGLIDAFETARSRGVRVRLAYDVDTGNPIPVPPPPRTEAWLVDRLGGESKPIHGVPDLMHHKFVVRDNAAVWTGSHNWTHDSMTRQENVSAIVDDASVAAAYTRCFDDIWSSGRVQQSGSFTPPDAALRAWFCPGRGRELAHRVAKVVGTARRRVRIASPVITSAPVLGALNESDTDVAGVYDASHMALVLRQWRTTRSAWKIPVFEQLVTSRPFGAKPSTPWTPDAIHDYMHAKVVVADDIAFLGSWNVSRSGERNAEGTIEVRDPGVADLLADFVDQVRSRYSATGSG